MQLGKEKATGVSKQAPETSVSVCVRAPGRVRVRVCVCVSFGWT